MAIKITDDCINCGACEPECPNHAIYENNQAWTMEEGTNVSGSYVLSDGREVDAYAEQEPLSEDFFYIVPDKCTECVGFHETPRCANICPVDCCIPDKIFEESHEDLRSKKMKLHE